MNRQSALLTVALVLLAVFTTAFAIINYNNPVKVWPLMTFQPVTLIIGVSFALGAGVSGLFVSLIHHQRALAVASKTRLTSDTTSILNAPTREQANRL